MGECVRQSVIDLSNSTTSSGSSSSGGPSLSGGVIAGLAVVGALVLLALSFLVFGIVRQRRARRLGSDGGAGRTGGVSVHWDNINYTISHTSEFVATYKSLIPSRRQTYNASGATSDQTILGGISGRVEPGQIMAILGPSGKDSIYAHFRSHTQIVIYIGAGKTTLVEILAGKRKSGETTGNVTFPSSSNSNPCIGFVPQQDILPPTLTASEALLFAARLRLPESIPDVEKRARVEGVMARLGITGLRDVRIGYAGGGDGGGKVRGISGGEMRRVSIGLELVSKPDVLILDEPTSG
jgi:ABC-type Mn2+/Zn2+ transport system ATPase subunit